MHSRLLIVDDEEPILFALREFFKASGYSVSCAREIEEAEALLTNDHYDVVIADLRLTGTYGTEGLELVQFIKDRCPRVSVILLTAYGSIDIEARAKYLGVDRFLHKPLALLDVARIVDELVEKGRGA